MQCACIDISCSIRLTGKLECLLTLFEDLFESNVFRGVKVGRTWRAAEDSTVLGKTSREGKDVAGEGLVADAFLAGSVGKTSKDTVFEAVVVGKTCRAVEGK